MNQRAQSDVQFEAFKKVISDTQYTSNSALLALDQYSHLDILRMEVDGLVITPLEVMDNYTQMNAYGLQVAGEMMVDNNDEFTNSLNLRFQIASMMEWLGIFRGTFSTILNFNNFESDILYRLIEINTKIQIYKNQFLWYSDVEAQLYSAIMNEPPIQLAQNIINQMKQAAFENFTTTINNTLSDEIDSWFGNMTIIIDAVNQVFGQLNSDVQKEFSDKRSINVIILIGLLIEFAVAVQLIWLAAPIVVFYFRGVGCFKRTV